MSGGVTAFIPYLMATEPFETIFEGVRERDRSRLAHRLRLSLHHLDRGAARGRAALRDRIRRAELQDLHEQSRRRRRAARSAGHRRRLPAAAVRERRQRTAAWCARIPKRSSLPGCCASARRRPIRTAPAASRHGTRAARRSSKPMPCSAPPISPAPQAVRSTSCTPHRPRRSTPRCGCAATAARCMSRRVRTTSRTTSSWSGGDIGKINPPLREASDREALWEGIRNGSVDTVATDHVHRDVSSKAGGIWTASPGCPGLDTLLPVMLSEGHHKRGIPLARIAELLATNPARIMGFGDAQGRHRGRARRGPRADRPERHDRSLVREVAQQRRLFDLRRLEAQGPRRAHARARRLRDARRRARRGLRRPRALHPPPSSGLAFSTNAAPRRDDARVGVTRPDKLQADRQALFARSSPASTGTARAAASTSR